MKDGRKKKDGENGGRMEIKKEANKEGGKEVIEEEKKKGRK